MAKKYMTWVDDAIIGIHVVHRKYAERSRDMNNHVGVEAYKVRETRKV